MNVRLNGTDTTVQAETIGALLDELSISTVGVAVAVNETVVRRAEHSGFRLKEDDQIEIIRAVQGG